MLSFSIELCCFECAFEESGNGHKLVKISDASISTLGDSGKTLEELKKTVEAGKEMLENLDKELEKIDSNSAEIVKKIEDACKSMREEIDRIERVHKEKLEEEITKTKDLIVARCEKLKETIEPIEVFIKSVETKANGDDVYVNLWNISEMTSANKTLEAIETEKLEDVQFSYPVDIAAEKAKLKGLEDSLSCNKSIISLHLQDISFTPINFDKLASTRNSTCNIPTGNSKTHDGGAIFDPEKRILVSVSGNYEYGKSLKVSKLGSDENNIKGETRLITNVVPFNTHGNYPVYDGEKWIYFFESESGSYNRFGRIDINNLDSKDFKELPSIPSGRFDEFSSSVYHFGSIYAVNNNNHKLWRFIVSVNYNKAILKQANHFSILDYRRTDGSSSR